MKFDPKTDMLEVSLVKLQTKTMEAYRVPDFLAVARIDSDAADATVE